MTPNEVFEKMKQSVPLPTPQGVALRLIELVEREETTLQEMAQAVESDPSIASRLLRLVNSPLGGLVRKTASVPQAVSMLGFTTVRNVAMGFELIADHKMGHCADFDYDEFWSESVARAVAARHLAQRIKKFSPEEAFASGLLSQIGRLAFATAYPDTYSEVLRTCDAGSLSETEQATFELDHCVLSAHLLEDWRLPDLFVTATQYQDRACELTENSRERMLAHMLSFGGAISQAFQARMVPREALTLVTIEANRLGINPTELEHVFAEISVEWQAIGEVFSVDTRTVPPLSRLYSHAH
jgi:HD-like signal output (HDOD) protein